MLPNVNQLLFLFQVVLMKMVLSLVNMLLFQKINRKSLMNLLQQLHRHLQEQPMCEKLFQICIKIIQKWFITNAWLPFNWCQRNLKWNLWNIQDIRLAWNNSRNQSDLKLLSEMIISIQTSVSCSHCEKIVISETGSQSKSELKMYNASLCIYQ